MTKGYRISASTDIDDGDRDYQQDQVTLVSHARVNGCILAVVADGMGAVSYTHLDVYKRQRLFRRISRVDDPLP